MSEHQQPWWAEEPDRPQFAAEPAGDLAGRPPAGGGAAQPWSGAGQQPGAGPPPGWGGWPPGPTGGSGWPPAGEPWRYAPYRRRPRVGPWLTALLVALAAVGGIGVGRLLWHAAGRIGPFTFPSGVRFGAPAGGSGSGRSGPANAAAVAAKVDPGLVDINASLGYQGAQQAGTGIVLTANGEVLTNNHVIEGATQVSVTDIGTGRTYVGRVLGYDRSHDIALVQLVGASGLPTVTLGHSSSLRTTTPVVAIGNAGGTGGTPSYAAGTVTGLNQSITAADDANGTAETLNGLIATNAAVVPGDSGGPLVTSSGEVVGVDTAASTGFRIDAGNGQAFAIPIDAALVIAQQIAAGAASGAVHVGPTAFLGVELSVSGGGFGLPPGGSSSGQGAQIAGVVPGGPAEQAGLGEGDTIVQMDGQAVSSAGSLTDLLLRERPGDTVNVVYLDPSGSQQSVSVQLADGPPQ